MKAMIFAAGLGTRLRPLTDTMPKALVPVAGKPLLQWQIEKLKNAGITDIVVNIHHFPDQIRNFISANDNFGCHILLSDESALLLETGGGLRKAAPMLGYDVPVLVVNVDVMSNLDIKVLLASYCPADAATLVVSERDTQRYLLFDEEGLLRGWHNISTDAYRPEQHATMLAQQCQNGSLKQLAFSGTHIVSPLLLRELQQWDDAFPIMDFYLNKCSYHSIRAFVPDGFRMLDVGKTDSLKQASEFLLSL
jgi:NDP-sugar pyrophosphorylase family protein